MSMRISGSPEKFKEYGRGSGDGSDKDIYGSRKSPLHRFRVFVSKHNTKLLCLWGLAALASLAKWRYDQTQNKDHTCEFTVL